MASKRVSKERAEQVKRELTDWLRAGNTGELPELLRKRFADIDRTTLWRWMDRARVALGGAVHAAEAVQVQQAAVKVTARQAAATASAPATAAHVVRAHLPRPVTPDSISALGNVSAVEMVHECIGHAREVLAFCKTDEGKIKNYKGMLAASSHMRSSIDTLARVVERMNDAAKINQIQGAIMDEIRAASPEVAERIVRRIDAIISDWGY